MLAMSAAIRDLDDFLEAPPNVIEPRHYRACLLALLGRKDQAQAAFMELLGYDAQHFGILNDFATFLFSSGNKKAAMLVLTEAVKWHPENSLGHTNLGCLYVSERDFDAARRHFEIALKFDPENTMAHEGMRTVLGRAQPAAPRKSSLLAPFAYAGDPIKVLVVEAAIGGNVFTHDFLADPAFRKTQVFLEHLNESVPLPEHDVIWSAIGDAERCPNLLAVAPSILARSTAPVVNAPHSVQGTTRADMAQRFSGIEGIVTPRIWSVPREELAAERAASTIAELGLQYPFLLRSPGFHTGEYFLRVDSPEELREAPSLPGCALTLIEFLDVRNADGKVRKYRVVIVDGEI
ncbi:MAG: hypothetical protein ACREMT_04710, partial [Vulcanimicrobiaceae bacterium]